MDETLRDLIAEAFALLWHEGAVSVDGVTADCDAVADMLLAMPEMQALRALVLDMADELAMYGNERACRDSERTSPSDEVRETAKCIDTPQSVVDWLLGD